MYCIYVSNNGTNIQKVINDSGEIVRTDNLQALMDFAKRIKDKYLTLNVSIVEEDTDAIIVDYQ